MHYAHSSNDSSFQAARLEEPYPSDSSSYRKAMLMKRVESSRKHLHGVRQPVGRSPSRDSVLLARDLSETSSGVSI